MLSKFSSSLCEYKISVGIVVRNNLEAGVAGKKAHINISNFGGSEAHLVSCLLSPFPDLSYLDFAILQQKS